MSASVVGPLTWSAMRNVDGERELKVVWEVETTSVDDGPIEVMNASGLFAIGSTWSLGNDSDTWLICSPKIEVAEYQKKRGDPHRYWKATQHFMTPSLHQKRCQDTSVENPLNEPDRVSGSFNTYTEEVAFDRFGLPILTSSHESLAGSIVEFDKGKDYVEIEQTIASMDSELPTMSGLKHYVNSTNMWGLSPRMVKFSNYSWTRYVYGTCTYYFTRRMRFDIDQTTFDRVALDEGQMVLNGRWDGGVWVLENITDSAGNDLGPPDPSNPLHFERFQDKKGENAKVILNGAGVPANQAPTGTGSGGSSNAGQIPIEYYPEADLLTELNLPTSFT